MRSRARVRPSGGRGPSRATRSRDRAPPDRGVDQGASRLRRQGVDTRANRITRRRPAAGVPETGRVEGDAPSRGASTRPRRRRTSRAELIAIPADQIGRPGDRRGDTSRPVARSIAGEDARGGSRPEGDRRSSFIGSRRGRRCRARQNASTSARRTRAGAGRATTEAGSGIDRGQAFQPRPSEQVDQDRLGLIVLRVALRDRGSADREPDVGRGVRSARATPTPRPTRRARAHRATCSDVQLEPEPAPRAAARRRYPRRSPDETWSISNVKTSSRILQQTTQMPQRVQEADRVGASGHAHEHEAAGLEHLVLAHGRGDAGEDPRDGRWPARRRHGQPPTRVTQRSGSATSARVGRFTARPTRG